MAKGKQNKPKYTHSSSRTSNYVHPSLAHSSPGPAPQSGSQPTSVNERLDRLRRAQARSEVPARSEDINTRTNAPLLAGRRRAAGPPPPRSWIIAPCKLSDMSLLKSPLRRSRSLAPFEGVRMPRENSLVDQTLKTMSQCFEDVLYCDHVFLSAIPIELRMQLLSYITKNGPEQGLSIDAVECLFAPELQDDAHVLKNSDGDPEGLKILDLGGAIGHGISFRGLSKIWRRSGKGRRKIADVTQVIKDVSLQEDSHSKLSDPHNDLPDSWDEVAEDSQTSFSLGPSLKPLRFPNLTHLALSYPSNNISWIEFVKFASNNLERLTHLSLEGWPMPSYGRTETNYTNAYGGSSVTVDSDNADAAEIFTLLSKATPSLRYINLADCNHWIDRIARFVSNTGTTNPASTGNRGLQPSWHQRLHDLQNFQSSSASAEQDSDDSHWTRRSGPVRKRNWFVNWEKLEILDLPQTILPEHRSAIVMSEIDRQMRHLANHQARLAHSLEFWNFWHSIDSVPVPGHAADLNTHEDYVVSSDDPEVVKSFKSRQLSREFSQRDMNAVYLCGRFVEFRAGAGMRRGLLDVLTPGKCRWILNVTDSRASP